MTRPRLTIAAGLAWRTAALFIAAFALTVTIISVSGFIANGPRKTAADVKSPPV